MQGQISLFSLLLFALLAWILRVLGLGIKNGAHEAKPSATVADTETKLSTTKNARKRRNRRARNAAQKRKNADCGDISESPSAEEAVNATTAATENDTTGNDGEVASTGMDLAPDLPKVEQT